MFEKEKVRIKDLVEAAGGHKKAEKLLTKCSKKLGYSYEKVSPSGHYLASLKVDEHTGSSTWRGSMLPKEEESILLLAERLVFGKPFAKLRIVAEKNERRAKDAEYEALESKRRAEGAERRVNALASRAKQLRLQVNKLVAENKRETNPTTEEIAHVSTTLNWHDASTEEDEAHASTAGLKSNASTKGICAYSSTMGDEANASTSGEESHAVAMGEDASASTEGSESHAITIGDYTNTSTKGCKSHSVAMGFRSYASTCGERSMAVALGMESSAKVSDDTSWIVLVEYIRNLEIVEIHRAKPGMQIKGVTIEKNVWYSIVDGMLVSKKEGEEDE